MLLSAAYTATSASNAMKYFAMVSVGVRKMRNRVDISMM